MMPRALPAALALALAFTTALVSAPALAEGDPAKGKKVFKKCKACHTLKAGKHVIGPSLFGVLGRQAGTAKGYEKKYKPDMKAAGEKGLVWNEDTLAAFLKKDGKNGPKQYIGSFIGKKKAKLKMTFPGIKNQADIDNLIAYLKASSQ